jgi:hypothetical protein
MVSRPRTVSPLLTIGEFEARPGNAYLLLTGGIALVLEAA